MTKKKKGKKAEQETVPTLRDALDKLKALMLTEMGDDARFHMEVVEVAFFAAASVTYYLMLSTSKMPPRAGIAIMESLRAELEEYANEYDTKKPKLELLN